MMRWRWHRVAVTTVALAAIALPAATANAGISGPCSASLAGTNVAGSGTGATAKPIVVGHDSSVPIVMSASGQLTHVRIELQFAGISWVVKDKVVRTPVYRDTIPVKNYARYGVGLYKVSGVGSGPGLSCSGSALVKVEGNPLTSIAGIGGMGAALLGAVGVFVAGLGATGGIRPFRVVRGSLAGLVLMLGALVLLQEASILYPTALVAIVGLVLGVAVGGLAATVPALVHATPTGKGITGKPATPAV